jgi:hypothetical protein
VALRNPKRPGATLLDAMARSAGRPRILYSQGRPERHDRGARLAAVGGSFRAEIPPQSQGVDNANGPTDTGNSSGNAKSSG